MTRRRAIALTAFVLACALLLTAPASAQNSISRDQELAIGRVTAVQIMAQYPVVADTEWLAFLGSLRDALAPFSGRTDVGHHIIVVEERVPNAASTPGYLFFTTGLIRLNLDRDGWAFIMAHEIAHTARRHVAVEIEKARGAAFVGILVAILTGSGTAGSAAEIVTRITSLGHSRGLEVEADIEAMRMMTEAGFNPEKAAATLRFMNEATGRRQEQTHWAGTHPGFAERVDRVEQARRQSADQGLPLRVQHYYGRDARSGTVMVRVNRVIETRRQWTAQVDVENTGTATAGIGSTAIRLILADGRTVDTTFLRSTLGVEVPGGRQINGAIVFERPEGGGVPASLVIPLSIGETHTEITLPLSGGGPVQPRPAPAPLPRPPAQ
ncbi:MAG: M48 family metalloprotease [bacterium]